jgi:hypothetical protein
MVVLFLTLLDGEKIAIGGLLVKKLKKLKGLRFTFPFPFKSIVDAKQMGRGAMRKF